MTKRQTEQTEEEVVFEPEAEAEGADTAAQCAAKLSRCKKELAQCRKERQEYLDGWQRAQADMINVRKETARQIAGAKEAGIAELVEALLPALDGFLMAMTSPAWREVDEQWRVGVEQLVSQLEAALAERGVSFFGEMGDAFDPSLHEAVGHEVHEGAAPETVVRVLQRGCRLGERLIRPARVMLAGEGDGGADEDAGVA